MNGALAFPFPAWQPSLCHSVVNVVAVVVVVVPLPRSLWLPTTTNIPSAAVWPTAPPSAKMGQPMGGALGAALPSTDGRTRGQWQVGIGPTTHCCDPRTLPFLSQNGKPRAIMVTGTHSGHDCHALPGTCEAELYHRHPGEVLNDKIVVK